MPGTVPRRATPSIISGRPSSRDLPWQRLVAHTAAMTSARAGRWRRRCWPGATDLAVQAQDRRGTLT